MSVESKGQLDPEPPSPISTHSLSAPSWAMESASTTTHAGTGRAANSYGLTPRRSSKAG